MWVTEKRSDLGEWPSSCRERAIQHNWGTSFVERPLLFHNLDHGKKFEVMPAVLGTGLADVLPARGAAFGDLYILHVGL